MHGAVGSVTLSECIHKAWDTVPQILLVCPYLQLRHVPRAHKTLHVLNLWLASVLLTPCQLIMLGNVRSNLKYYSIISRLLGYQMSVISHPVWIDQQLSL